MSRCRRCRDIFSPIHLVCHPTHPSLPGCVPQTRLQVQDMLNHRNNTPSYVSNPNKVIGSLFRFVSTTGKLGQGCSNTYLVTPKNALKLAATHLQEATKPPVGLLGICIKIQCLCVLDTRGYLCPDPTSASVAQPISGTHKSNFQTFSF